MALDFPSSPVNGQVYDNFYYDASMGTWRAYGTVNLAIPAGIINQYGGSTAPAGYLMCTGQSVLTSDYPALFQAIGYTYGGSGANFSVPNLQNRVPVGKGTEVEFDTLGETGGEKTVALSATQIPGHTHSGTTGGHSADHSHTYSGSVSGGTHQHLFFMDDGAANHATRYNNVGTYDATSNNSSGNGGWFWTPGGNSSYDGSHSHTYSGTTSGTSSNHTHNFTTDNGTGGGQAHNNLQPYIVLNYIIKT